MDHSLLVVGLGNPGDKYRGTRHNVGRDFIDHLASEWNESFREKGRAECFRRALSSSGEGPVALFAKLDCYMNESGPALQSLMTAHRSDLKNVLVIVDDFAIPFGSFRLRPGGSAGGHNGLRSIIEVFGDQFARLRVGVGPLPEKWDQVGFVLGKFAPAERDKMSALYDGLLAAIGHLTSDGMERAMSKVNSLQF